MSNGQVVGTVIFDGDTPTFDSARLKLRAGCDLKPGALVCFETGREGGGTLIGRVRGGREINPYETPQDVAVRDSLHLTPAYPGEKDSTTIFRVVEIDLIEEMYVDEKGDRRLRAPETLPSAGADVMRAGSTEVTTALGLADPEDPTGLCIGQAAGGTKVPICLKRESIQRHFFIGGTTGSGKSHAMGVLAEELIKQRLPIVFLDTQDEYTAFVEKHDGHILTPGDDFQVRISSLTDNELTDLVPAATPLHKNIIAAAFLELQEEMFNGHRSKFVIDDLLEKMGSVGPRLVRQGKAGDSDLRLALMRASHLKRDHIFGEGLERNDWREKMQPCVAIKGKHLSQRQLQMVTTGVLRELQGLRIRKDGNGNAWIPPYVAVIDEAHLFVPDGEDTPCKQIIREGVRIGRHHGISMVLLTQSPVDIDKRTIRQCNTRLVFALEPDQLDAIRGVKADASEEMLRAMPKMPRGTCVLSGTYESVKHATLVRVRERETENADGGKTPDVFREMRERWANGRGGD